MASQQNNQLSLFTNYLEPQGRRYFASSGKGGPEKQNNDYESGFDNLMKDGKITEEESEKFKQRRDQKAEQLKEDKQKSDEIHDKKFKEGEQDFDDFL